MKPHIKLPCTILAAALQLAAIAAVPLAWEARPSSPAPASFDRHHGETIEFRCTLTGFDAAFAPAADVRLYYQTNGMGQAWWSAPATVQSNVITATWSPALDPGADRVSLFFGAPSNVYASAVLRLRHSPGFTPSVLTLPVQRLDFAAVEIANAPYYTKAETEAKIAELSPPTSLAPATNYTDSATNALSSVLRDTIAESTMYAVQSDGTDWQNVLSKTSSITQSGYLPYPWYFNGQAFAAQELAMQADDGNYEHHLVFDDMSMRWITWYAPPGEDDTYDESTGRRSTQHDIAYLDDIPSPPDLTPYATKSALQSVSNIVEDTRAESALVYRLYSGSNVVAEVTNYNSQVHAPSLRLMQLNESNEYFTVWAETNGLARTLNSATAYTDSATNELKNTYAPRAWSRTTSGLGSDAPANTTWISTPRTVIAGGLEYAKIVDTYGEAWVLASNGMGMDFNPDTNAYFRITADDGTPVFSIEKSDAQVLGANASGITASANSITIPVPVVSAEAPTMYWRNQLDSGDWSDQATPPTGASVTWTGSAGSWVCTVTFSGTRPPSMFFKFSFIQEGGVVIRNNATTDLSSGIWVNGTKFVPTVSGNNLIWTKQ